VAARTKARKRALDLLYEADLRSTEPALERLAATDYAVTLVEGVIRERERIDERIATYAEGWTLDRMPAVDRTILRLAVWELLWAADVPDAVAIDEAVELAKAYAGEESGGFVNGVLGRIASERV